MVTLAESHEPRVMYQGCIQADRVFARFGSAKKPSPRLFLRLVQAGCPRFKFNEFQGAQHVSEVSSSYTPPVTSHYVLDELLDITIGAL